jgi:hypothetical protein
VDVAVGTDQRRDLDPIAANVPGEIAEAAARPPKEAVETVVSRLSATARRCCLAIDGPKRTEAAVECRNGLRVSRHNWSKSASSNLFD